MTSGAIEIRGLRVLANVGVPEAERVHAQPLSIDLVLTVDLEEAGRSDDVADTGRTLELVHQFCEGNVAEARTVVIYEKPQSVSKPDYSWRVTEQWIDFPWSVLPPVVPGALAH